MKLLVVNDCKDSISEDFLNQWVQQISSDLIKKNILKPELVAKELSVVLLDERDAKKINWQYRTKDYAADVLSFQTDDPESFGELVMCPQVIRRQAVDHKLKYEQEMVYMVLHGVLHLLGYDHEKGPEDEKKMFSIQDEIFEKHILKKEKKSSTGKSSASAKGSASAKSSRAVKSSSAAKISGVTIASGAASSSSARKSSNVAKGSASSPSALKSNLKVDALKPQSKNNMAASPKATTKAKMPTAKASNAKTLNAKTSNAKVSTVKTAAKKKTTSKK